MNTRARLESISGEFSVLKNRVRDLIGDKHWPSDGAAKESILRVALRRYLPTNVGVGTGFVVGTDDCSGQIDVLLYDTFKPVLYRDGDFLCITSDAVKGIIEVKTKIDYPYELRDALSSIINDIGFIRTDIRRFPGRYGHDIFAALFSYESDLNPTKDFVADFRVNTEGSIGKIVNFASIGPDYFVRFWNTPPVSPRNLEEKKAPYQRWHSYCLKNLAPGYFVDNVVACFDRPSVHRNQDLWFLEEGKEINKIGECSLRDAGLGEK